MRWKENITQTKNTQMCEKKLRLSMVKCTTLHCSNSNTTAPTEIYQLNRYHIKAESVMLVRRYTYMCIMKIHGNHKRPIHQRPKISTVIIFTMAIISLVRSLSLPFGYFDRLQTHSHPWKITTRRSQLLHNLTPCYSKCILLNHVECNFRKMHWATESEIYTHTSHTQYHINISAHRL